MAAQGAARYASVVSHDGKTGTREHFVTWPSAGGSNYPYLLDVQSTEAFSS